jgi:hypothetical protein
LTTLVDRVRAGRLRTFVGDVVSLEEAATAFSAASGRGKTIVQVVSG